MQANHTTVARWVRPKIFGFKMVSCFRKRNVGICECSSIETKSRHTTTRVVYVIGYTKCTQTPNIILYPGFRYTLPVPMVKWVPKQLQSQTPPWYMDRSSQEVGFGIEYFHLTLPSPDSFSDQEDDASSIDLLCIIIAWLFKERENQQPHPPRPVASNIVPRFGIVAVVAMMGVLVWNHAWSNVQDCPEGPKLDHLLQ